MQRRDFLRFSGLASAGLVLPPSISSAFAQAPTADPWRIFEVTTRVEVLKPSGATRVWLPTPLLEDTAYIKPLGNAFQAENGASGFTTDPKYGAGIVWAEWAAGTRPVMVMKSRFATHDVAVDFSKPGNAEPEERAVLAKYTAATDLMPTDGAVKELSSSIVKGAKTDIEKARAIYDWIVDNTHRDGKVRGCGVGDIKFMVENKASAASAPTSTRSTWRSRGPRDCRHATSTASASRIRRSATRASARAATSPRRSTAAPRFTCRAMAGCRWIPPTCAR